MPDSKAKALTAAALVAAAIVPSKETGRKALNELLSEGKIQGAGKCVAAPAKTAQHLGENVQGLTSLRPPEAG